MLELAKVGGMENFQEINSSIVVNFPILYWGAIGFYVSILLYFSVRSVRLKFQNWLAPVSPSNQSVLSPFDAFRGLAALWVACFHAWEWNQPLFDRVTMLFPSFSNGPKAVAIFGVLSGFLVYRSICNWSDAPQLKAYFERRFFRIYPVFFLVMLSFLLLANREYGTPPQLFLAQFLMAPIFHFQTNAYPPFWSLFVEELFYIVLPAWVLFSRSKPLLWSGIGSLIFLFLVGSENNSYSLFFYFFLGVLACNSFQSNWLSKVPAALSWLALVLGCALFYIDIRGIDPFGMALQKIGSLLGYHHFTQKHYTSTLGIGFLLILLASIRLEVLHRPLAFFPLRYLGRISYSIFAWHPMLISVGAVFTLGAGSLLRQKVFGPNIPYPLWVFFGVLIPAYVFFGSLSYACIERPFLVYSRKNRIAKEHTPDR